MRPIGSSLFLLFFVIIDVIKLSPSILAVFSALRTITGAPSCHNMACPHAPCPISVKSAVKDIKLTARLSEQMDQLCMSYDYSDLTFFIEDEKLPAHRAILAGRSEYFRALLYGGLPESTQTEIHLKIPLNAFKTLLKYIYSGTMAVTEMKEKNILDTLGLAHQYGIIELEIAILDYLRQIVSLDNACTFLHAAELLGLDELTNICHAFLDRNAEAILQHETFKTLSRDAICSLLMRDTFFAPEMQIFHAVRDWCKRNSEGRNVDAMVSQVRFSLMTLEQLLRVVRPSGIVDSDRLMDAIDENSTSTQLPYRGVLQPEENVACSKFNSQTIQGEDELVLLNGDTKSYDGDDGYTWHRICDDTQGIVVELGKQYIINHIKILLWDRDTRSYSYFVEMSVNQTNWERVVDHTDYHCRSWQYLYFPSRAVRYIRLMGTHNTENHSFHVVALEAMFTEKTAQIVNGIVAPSYNVATVNRSATVDGGVSNPGVLLDGHVQNYGLHSGYTSYDIGSDAIVVQLGQPYWIGSLRLLLWDGDDRSYSFYIESSTNRKQWDMLVDKRNDLLKSWQHFTFEPRPIVFIKIVGTHNTANDEFHCVHFECPSQDPKFLSLALAKSADDGIRGSNSGAALTGATA